MKQGAAACTAGDLGDEFFVIEPLGGYGGGQGWPVQGGTVVAGGGCSKVVIGWLRVVR